MSYTTFTAKCSSCGNDVTGEFSVIPGLAFGSGVEIIAVINSCQNCQKTVSVLAREIVFHVVEERYYDGSDQLIRIATENIESPYGVYAVYKFHKRSTSNTAIYRYSGIRVELLRGATKEVEDTPSKAIYKINDRIMNDIAKERIRQDELHGEENHDAWRWLPILGEEFGEVQKAMNEGRMDHMRSELVQVAATAVKWLESIDRNK